MINNNNQNNNNNDEMKKEEPQEQKVEASDRFGGPSNYGSMMDMMTNMMMMFGAKQGGMNPMLMKMMFLKQILGWIRII